MSSDKENTTKLLTEYEYYKGQIEALQEGLGLIDTSILQIETTIHSLKGISELKKENSILIPVGSDSFLSAKITDTKNAIVGIGADVAVKKTVKDAVAELVERKKELENVRNERVDALEKTVAIAQQMAPKLQELMAKSQKEV